MTRFNWRIHGAHTLSYRLADLEIPQILNTALELASDETLTILHGETGVENLTQHTLPHHVQHQGK